MSLQVNTNHQEATRSQTGGAFQLSFYSCGLAQADVVLLPDQTPCWCSIGLSRLSGYSAPSTSLPSCFNGCRFSFIWNFYEDFNGNVWSWPYPSSTGLQQIGICGDAKSKGVHITQALSLKHGRYTLHGFSKVILIPENSQWEGSWNVVVFGSVSC